MQEDRPFVPRVVQCLSFSSSAVCQDPEAALCIRMGEWISLDGRRFGRLRVSHPQRLQKGPPALPRADARLCRTACPSSPFGRPVEPFFREHRTPSVRTCADCRTGAARASHGGLWPDRVPPLRLKISTSSNAHRATSTSCIAPVVGCRLNLAPLGPFVGVVVVVDIDQQDAGGGAVDDDPDVGIHPHRPEVRVLSRGQACGTTSRSRSDPAAGRMRG